jgi:hypothetical protein
MEGVKDGRAVGILLGELVGAAVGPIVGDDVGGTVQSPQIMGQSRLLSVLLQKASSTPCVWALSQKLESFLP